MKSHAYALLPFRELTMLCAGLGFCVGLVHASPRADLPVLSAVVVTPAPRPAAEAPARLLPATGARAAAADARLEWSSLESAEAAVRAAARAGSFPGAALVAGRKDAVGLAVGVGHVGWTASAAEVDPERTVYDLASLTKVVATTAAAMVLTEQAKLEVDAPVSRYLPEFGGGAKDGITIRHLLTHTSGLPAGASLNADNPDASMRKAFALPLTSAPGERAVYSDIGFVVLWAALERAAGEPLYALLDREVYGPLKMRTATFVPGEGCDRCAPTYRLKDGTPVSGVVHDPVARKLGGIAGNAGLFATAADVSRYAAMLANGGELDGVRVLEAKTIRDFGARQPGAGTRALGWDTPGPNGSGGAGVKLSKEAFGHTGYTGTSLWVDPERGTWAVLLSNRTYAPRAPNTMQSLRRKVNDRVAVAADHADVPALAE
jgi:CubicO group peptidase (beta-lactamase class C family)